MRRAGTRQNGDISGVTPFLVSHKTHSTIFGFSGLSFFRPFLSIRKTEKLSDGVTAVSGTEGVSHVSVKQKMLQSLVSRWKLILALRSSILFSKDWTLASRTLGRAGLLALFLSLLRIPARFPRCSLRLLGLFRWPMFNSVLRSISNGHAGSVDKVSCIRLV